MMRKPVLTNVILMSGILAALADSGYAADAALQCRQLEGIELEHVEILISRQVPAGLLELRGGIGREVPAFCRVRGIARPTRYSNIGFEVWLPAPGDWNGRYYQHADGADSGRINEMALVQFVREGSAAANTDSGNQTAWYDGGGDGDIQIAYARAARTRESPERVIDLSYRGSYETTRAAKAILREYYGSPQKYSYLVGCSGGGSQALRNAQSYPQEWDGILAGAPSNNVTGYFSANAWNARLWVDPQGRIPYDKLPAIQQAALASCSKEARVHAGIASDPRHCRTDVRKLICRGQETRDCLTRAQADSLEKIYGGPRNPRTGEQIYPGFPPTTEQAWQAWLTDSPRRDASGNNGPGSERVFRDVPFSVFSANLHYRYVFSDPAWNAQMMDFDRDLAFAASKPVAGAPLKEVVDAVDPNLSRLQKRGAKILMYFGWGDPALTPLEGIEYYDEVSRTVGSGTRQFFRLFMVPGMSHCTGGPGANSFGQSTAARALRNDPEHHILRALEAWTETGRAPDRITAAKYVDDDPDKGVAFTRALCPYPQVATYDGTPAGACMQP